MEDVSDLEIRTLMINGFKHINNKFLKEYFSSDDDYEVGQVAWSNQDAGFILECFNLWKFASSENII